MQFALICRAKTNTFYHFDSSEDRELIKSCDKRAKPAVGCLLQNWADTPNCDQNCVYNDHEYE